MPILGVNSMSLKPSYKTVEFDVLVRHNDLKKAISSGPAWKRVETYLPIARKRAGTFFHSQQKLCKQMGYEYEDVLQYTTCWAVNYTGRFEMQNKPEIENKRLFSAYLNQRLQEFSEILQKKNRSVNGDTQLLEEWEEFRADEGGVSFTEMMSKLTPEARKKALRKILRSKNQSAPVKLLAKQLLNDKRA